MDINTLLSEGSWIYYPKEIQFLVSNDGINYQSIQIISQKEIETKKGKVVIDFPKLKAKFIKIVAKNNGIIADGKPGAGSNSWLFVDEISVE